MRQALSDLSVEDLVRSASQMGEMWRNSRHAPPDPIEIRGLAPEQRDVLRLSADELRATGYVTRTDAIDRALKLIELEAPTITVVGPQGVGKTTIAAWVAFGIAQRRRARGERCLLWWGSCADLAAEARQVRYGASDAELFARGAPIVVLDDLGQERTSEDSRELLVRMVTHRFGRRTSGLVTIVTTGLRSAQIQERYGAGAFRRLCDPKAIALIDCRPVNASAPAQAREVAKCSQKSREGQEAREQSGIAGEVDDGEVA
jgi:hypothetical protein